ncbi:hypothetical protein H0H92_007693 [Tricholoma furcatifolium]|nr:hypothetical protein H0H92_007693 [Tricholoma furcatifolium]
MDMETRNLPLRILYTVGGSQYILSRSFSPVAVLIVPYYDKGLQSITDSERPVFATAPLKACLNVICTSSPELLQDKRRDFSVYVLDPLESTSAPPHAPTTSQLSSCAPEQPRGVAVALGLMSWALMLEEKDSTPVTGTVIRLPTGQEALEIIFSLKETVAMEKASLPAALRTWGLPSEPTHASTLSHHPSHFLTADAGASSSSSTPSPSSMGQAPVDAATLATIAAIQMRSQNKRAKTKAKKPAKTSTIDPLNSEADRLMLTHYIGPERKKAGRPPNAVASGSKSKAPTRTHSQSSSSTVFNSIPPATTENPIEITDSNVPHNTTHHFNSSNTTQARSSTKTSHETPSNPFTKTPLIRAPRDPEPQNLLDVLALLSASSPSSDPNVQNMALLAALGAVDSTGSSAPGLPAKSPNPVLLHCLRDLITATAQKQQQQPATTSTPSNPLSSANAHNRAHPQDDDIVILDKENVNPSVFRRRSERSGKLSETEPSTSTVSPSTALTSSGQTNIEPTTVRGLSSRHNANISIVPVAPAPAPSSSNTRRKRTLSDIMDERERENKGKGKGKEREWVERRDAHRYAHSSPRRDELSSIRHYPRLASDNAQHARRASGSYYRTPEVWTSPVKPSLESQSNENSIPKPMAIDAPLPPLKIPASSPIKTTSKTRRPYVLPVWARTSTATQPRLSEGAIQAMKMAEEKKREEKARKRKGPLRSEKENKLDVFTRPTSPLRQAATDRPKQPSASASQPPPPVTVASDAPVFATVTSVIQDRIAAFSASSTSPEPQSPGPGKATPPCTPPRKRHSALFSPGEDGSLFTPMPGRDFSAKTPRGFESANRNRKTPTPKAMVLTNEDGNDASGEESDDDLEEALNRELERDQLPPSPLPEDSSSIEQENEPTPDDMCSDACDDTNVAAPRKEHWVGLPPSSPPPPTSPLLMPLDHESDDTMLPAVTSDADPCPTDSEGYSDSFYTNEPSTCTDDEIAEYIKSDFASIFPPDAQQAFGSSDLFDQFTNLNAQSDDTIPSSIPDSNLDMVQNGLLDMDFTELWETFKPLLQDQNGSTVVDPMGVASEQLPDSLMFDPTSFDHVKLAEDVQALFSGCVV